MVLPGHGAFFMVTRPAANRDIISRDASHFPRSLTG
jgi:hypothetical protein